jgi:NADPH-dependent 2,4-dienoyl-CoA reductase/sulfur reductase-like enzyme
MRTIAVVGGGIAGHEAAWAARRQDPSSRVILLQEEPHPLYSACVLADYVSGEIPRERVFLLGAQDYARAGIEFHPGRPVVGVDPPNRVLLLEGRELSYDSLVLATGSRPLLPPIPGAQLHGVHTLKSLADADRLALGPAGKAVVVGAGPVGIECALALAARGSRVHLVELLPRLLPRLLDTPLAGMVQAMLEQRGIRVLTGERVLEIQGRDRVEGVKTTAGFLEADGVILVLGMRPEVRIAGQASVGLGASGGIRVDGSMATDTEGIWSCGDCVESRDLINGRIGLQMLWANAVQQGRVAGANAAGGKRSFPGSLNVTTVRIAERAVASVGATASDLEAQGASLFLNKDVVGNAIGIVLMDGRVIGAQAVGPIERVGGLIRILLQGGGLGDLAGEARGGSPGTRAARLWPLRGLERGLSRFIR